jgi:hypothetical protein
MPNVKIQIPREIPMTNDERGGEMAHDVEEQMW